MKPPPLLKIDYHIHVAPRRGAWIETGRRAVSLYGFLSPPAGGRGLKLCLVLEFVKDIRRPPQGGVD